MVLFYRSSEYAATDIPTAPVPTVSIDIISESSGHQNPSFESSWEGLPPSYEKIFETDLKLPPPAYENISFASKVDKNDEEVQ